MFKWTHEHRVEVDISLQKVWAFFTDPNNWPKSDDQLESCLPCDELKNGSIVKLKIKNTKKTYLPILVSEIKPQDILKLFIKAPFFSQETTETFQEISSTKTLITIKASVKSLFVPFMRSFFLRKLDQSNSKFLKALLESQQTPIEAFTPVSPSEIK